MNEPVVSEQDRRATLSMLALGTFETSPDGGWDFVSQELLNMLGGLPMSSLLRRQWLTRVHPDDVQRVLAEYKQARDNARTWSQHFRMLDASGRVVHVGVDAAPLPRDPDARGLCYVGLMKDRTQVVRELEIAAESGELLHTLQEAVREGVVINRQEITVVANTAAARILGFERPEDIIGMDGGTRVHPDDYERLMQYARSNRESFMTGRFMRRDGTPVQCIIHGRSITFAGAPARLVTFVPVSDPLVGAAAAVVAGKDPGQ